MAKQHPRSRSRAQQRYNRKMAVQRSSRPVSTVGGGQGGLMGPSMASGGVWG